MQLKDLIAKGEQAIAATSQLLALQATHLDCSDVESLTESQLDALFSEIPEDWDFAQLGEVIDPASMSEQLAEQICDRVNQRHSRASTTATSEETTDNRSQPTPFQTDNSRAPLDIFRLRDEVIDDYRRYIESFLTIRDNRVKNFVDEELGRGQLWRDPLVQINLAYQQGSSTDELIKRGILHPDCRRYFPEFRFYRHQEEAFLAANRGESYVLTTGTGSGKSMAYVVPIFDDLLRNPQIEGVRAILVYPMNALINSQKEEFEKYLSKVSNSHIRVEQYTGQESLEQKSAIQNNPPHVLLTNYVMLELMLSRTAYEKKLVSSPNLKFLVLDELHTYRGRQGADVAMVVRKLRERCQNNNLLCIGTSATMATEGSREDRRQTVAGVASQLFGVEVPTHNTIDETLERAIARPEPDVAELHASLTEGLPPQAERTKEAFLQHPLAAWIENNFGLVREGDRLVRRQPISISQGAQQLAEETGVDRETCRETLEAVFLWGSQTGAIAFRLHQFISQGGSVYATLESRDNRSLTLEGQYATSGDRLLYPLKFCRECGQDYYLVRYNREQNTLTPLLPNDVETQIDGEDVQQGYFTLDEPGLWEPEEDINRLPDNWFNDTKRYGRRVKKDYKRYIPQSLHVYPNGNIASSSESDPEKGIDGWFVPQPFLTCLNCGVVHDSRSSEYSKLSRLSSEGRSTATTLLCLSTVSRLRNASKRGAIAQEANKILSFTDNRQDASLQAGHFNDFTRTSFLRAALYRALQQEGELTHDNLAVAVVERMGLSQESYAQQPVSYGKARLRNEETFRDLVEYRLYEDLRRGWRIVQPNLEQCGLLEIEYEGLWEICQNPQPWRDRQHPILLQATSSQRYQAAKVLLDQLRKELAIDAKSLQKDEIDKLRKRVEQTLVDVWQIDSAETLQQAKYASLSSGQQNNRRTPAEVKLTVGSKVGKFLRSERAWPWLPQPLSKTEYNDLIEALVEVLHTSGFLRRKNQDNKVQLRVTSIKWKVSNADTIAADPLTSKRLQGSEEPELPVNRFFKDFYQHQAFSISSLEGREHTGQVSNYDRQEREDRFRRGQLSALFCSPTMELGIDISDLNVVHLRNVPPSPANYAQRSGRAGRGGSEALVISYASASSGHDQYFYQRQEQMVAGVVFPPKLELANQDMVISHLHSLWLAWTGADLGRSMNEILDLDCEGYPLKESIQQQLTLSPEKLEECVQAARSILSDRFCQQDLQRTSWGSESWLRQTLENALNQFDQACDRWRNLYHDAVTQLQKARSTIDRAASGGVSKKERDNAEDLRQEAERQRALLVGQEDRSGRTDFAFYPYRYLASEGFLPGFNFPRLPVRAYIRAGDKSAFLARPKVVAIRELAPNNIVYYEGSTYQVNKTKLPVGGPDYQRAALCANCGYFHAGDGISRDTCEHCGARITTDSNGNPAKLNRLFTLESLSTRRYKRITCDEEERLKHGYNITTHFRFAEGKQEPATVTDSQGKKLLQLTYGETAELWRVNRGLRRANEQGFKLDLDTGEWWGNKAGNNTKLPENLQTEVNLMVSDTCNVMLVELAELPDENAQAYLATFQHAIERAIQTVYKLEENELLSERLGEGNYLLFWEASEGGAGVLSRILENPKAFQRLADTALEISHFQQEGQPEQEGCARACYKCLLSYSNQFDHPLLDRYLVRTFLEQLQTSTLQRHQEDLSRDEHYQKLRSQIDPNSPLEADVLDELYQRGIKLPDTAQELIPEAQCKPDFLYKKAKVAVFCDGSVHDRTEQRQKDQAKRDDLEYNTRYHVFVLRHDEDWRSRLDELAKQV